MSYVCFINVISLLIFTESHVSSFDSRLIPETIQSISMKPGVQAFTEKFVEII
jgi:hypothetical protein